MASGGMPVTSLKLVSLNDCKIDHILDHCPWTPEICKMYEMYLSCGDLDTDLTVYDNFFTTLWALGKKEKIF